MAALSKQAERALHWFSFRLVPIAIIAASVCTLFFLNSEYQFAEPIPEAFRIMPDAQTALTPARARSALAAATPVLRYDTHLSEVPFWFSFTVAPRSDAQPNVVEFPSRHAQSLDCWNADTLADLGHADRNGATRPAELVGAGFAVRLGQPRTPTNMLCRGTFSGPARIQVNAWGAHQLTIAGNAFHRDAGLLEGGILTLALFVLITALINHESMYVLFAAWLVGNLRLAALSTGSDTQWLGQTLPPQWMSLIREVTIAVYYILTCVLLMELFRNDLKAVRGHKVILRVITTAGCVLLVLALILPYRTYLPAMWVLAGLGIAGLTFLLVRLIIVTRSRVAWWYGGSMAVTLLASFSEVLAAAFGLKSLLNWFNSVTAALLSSMMAALAIAEQIRAERHTRVLAQTELRKTYEATPIGLFTLDLDGRIVRGNPALCRMLGMSAPIGADDHWQSHFEHGAWKALRDMVTQKPDEEIEVHNATLIDEHKKWFLVKAAMADGQIEGSLQDVTERVRANERLRFLAENDMLTGALNRRGIEKMVQRAMRMVSPDKPFALAYLDLDRFKLINDLFGHQAGDEVLQQVARRITDVLGKHQAVGRLGGDEFLIVLQDTSIDLASETSRRIVDRVSIKPYKIGRRAFQVKGSIGLIRISERMRLPEAISAADRACRDAKQSKDRLVVYEKNAPSLNDRVEELRLIEQLGTNFSSVGLYLEMQPLMSLRSPEEALDFEVLLRMRDTEGNLIPANKIIAAAEENGNISELDKWVLSSALEWLSANLASLTKTRFVCVNLSGASLNDEHFIEDIFVIIAQYAHVIHLLCIEITEGVALHDLENTRRFIGRLQDYGAKIALDDFGAGYTSFSYLKDLPADALKIDGAFIRSMSSHPANAAIVEAIVALARNLGMRSIAEWVEDYATLEALAALGVDYVQGWIVARPQAPQAILEAESAAHFVIDPQVAAYVRRAREGRRPVALPDAFSIVPPSDLH